MQRPRPSPLADGAHGLSFAATATVKNTFLEVPCTEDSHHYSDSYLWGISGFSTAPASLHNPGAFQDSWFIANADMDDSKFMPATPSTTFESSTPLTPMAPWGETLWAATPTMPGNMWQVDAASMDSPQSFSPSQTFILSPPYGQFCEESCASAWATGQGTTEAPQKQAAEPHTSRRMRWADIPADGASDDEEETARSVTQEFGSWRREPNMVALAPLETPSHSRTFPLVAPGTSPAVHATDFQIFACVANASAPKFAPPCAPAPCLDGLKLAAAPAISFPAPR